MKDLPILSVKNVSKEFPGVKALSDVSLEIYAGEVHVLIGENGAGKSTLIKILSGVYPLQEGSIVYKGESVNFRSPREARVRGIAVIHQELSVVPDLTVAENIFLGRENTKGFFIDRSKTNEIVREYFEQLSIDIPPDTHISDLSNAEKQMVEIARAISMDASVIIMDEPTASLADAEVNALFRVIYNLKAKNVAIIYISHRMNELFEIGDMVTVLRDGCLVKTTDIKNIDSKTLISLMVGREITNFFNKKEHAIGQTILDVKNLTRRGEFSNVSFSLCKGEIAGIAGLVGSGRTELLKAIFGVAKIDSGGVIYKGRSVSFRSPRDAIKARIGFVPEERRSEGIIVDDDVKRNISLPSLMANKRHGLVDRKWEKEVAKKYTERLRIKTPSIHAVTKNLSGGNQQKVVIAKWWAANSELLLLDELTRGIDVNAKAEIYGLINDYVKNGGTVLMVSSELPELLGVCDRIMVMREGDMVGSLDISEATEEKIMNLASV